MRNRSTKAAVAAAVLALAAAPPALQAETFPIGGYTMLGSGPLVATSSEIFISFLGFDAQYTDEIQLRYDLMYGGQTFTIFDNKTAGSTVWRVNDFIEDYYDTDFWFTPGENVIFSLYVNPVGSGSELNPGDFGQTYYTNNWLNPDGEIHSLTAMYEGSGEYMAPGAGDLATPAGGAGVGSRTGTDGMVYFDRQVGFEDLLDGGDFDYNDVVFAASGVDVVPEPMSMLLMATGLIGIGGVAYRRKRNEVDEA